MPNKWLQISEGKDPNLVLFCAWLLEFRVHMDEYARMPWRTYVWSTRLWNWWNWVGGNNVVNVPRAYCPIRMCNGSTSVFAVINQCIGGIPSIFLRSRKLRFFWWSYGSGLNGDNIDHGVTKSAIVKLIWFNHSCRWFGETWSVEDASSLARSWHIQDGTPFNWSGTMAQSHQLQLYGHWRRGWCCRRHNLAIKSPLGYLQSVRSDSWWRVPDVTSWTGMLWTKRIVRICDI